MLGNFVALELIQVLSACLKFCQSGHPALKYRQNMEDLIRIRVFQTSMIFLFFWRCLHQAQWVSSESEKSCHAARSRSSKLPFLGVSCLLAPQTYRHRKQTKSRFQTDRKMRRYVYINICRICRYIRTSTDWRFFFAVSGGGLWSSSGGPTCRALRIEKQKRQ